MGFLLAGLLIALLAIWLVPFWLLPWLTAIVILAWAYYCVVKSGYPAVPTYAWAVPFAAAQLAGALLGRPWTLAGWAALAGFLTLYFSASARWFWYVRLFRWRPDGRV